MNEIGSSHYCLLPPIIAAFSRFLPRFLPRPSHHDHIFLFLLIKTLDYHIAFQLPATATATTAMSLDGNIVHEIMSSGTKRPSIITQQDGSLPKRRLHGGMEEATHSAIRSGSPDHDNDSILNEWNEQQEEAIDLVTIGQNEDNDNLLEDEDPLFIVSPLGLCCRHPNCIRRQIVATDRSIRDHLRSHDIHGTTVLVQKYLKRVEEEARNARLMQSLELYRLDNKLYTCFTCGCGKQFPIKRSNAVAHCNKLTNNCDAVHITTATAIKLRCGRYVTAPQVDSFLNAFIPQKLRNYYSVRDFLSAYLPEKEKGDHSYTPMFYALFQGCSDFVGKINHDHKDIHYVPDPVTECMLILILKQAKYWLLTTAKYDILSLPGQIRAALQSFEGVVVNDISQKTTYTMQHNPRSILPVLNKLLACAYRRRLFTECTGFDP